MLDFLTPEVFEGLIWAVILIGGAFAVLRLLRDLTGPPRWPDGEVRPGGGTPGRDLAARGSSAPDDPFAPDSPASSGTDDESPRS